MKQPTAPLVPTAYADDIVIPGHLDDDRCVDTRTQENTFTWRADRARRPIEGAPRTPEYAYRMPDPRAYINHTFEGRRPDFLHTKPNFLGLKAEFSMQTIFVRVDRGQSRRADKITIQSFTPPRDGKNEILRYYFNTTFFDQSIYTMILNKI